MSLLSNANTNSKVKKYIAERQQDFQTRIEQRDEKQARLDEILRQIKTIDQKNKEWKVRERAHLCEQSKDLIVELDDIDTGKSQRLFEKTVRPFLRASEQATKRAQWSSKVKTKVKSDAMYNRKRKTSMSGNEANDKEIFHQMVYTMEGMCDGSLVDKTHETCPECNVELRHEVEYSALTCSSCGFSIPFLDSIASTSTSFAIAEGRSGFAYKRANHLLDWLNHIQAREKSTTPDKVLNDVMTVLAEKKVPRDEVSLSKVRGALKSLGMRQYYENTTHIWCKITGNAPPCFPPHILDQIKCMFRAMIPAFEKHRPPGRKNFLSYSFCLFRILQLLGCEDFLEKFPIRLLKGKAKLKIQDAIYKKNCKELDWEYIKLEL